jgi:hypothetical protein
VVLLLLVVAVVTAACSSGRSQSAATRSTTSAPAATAGTGQPTTTAAVASTCAPGPTTPGQAGGKDVTPPGDIPDTKAFVAFPSPSHYSIKFPEGWSRADQGTTTTFTDKLNTIRVEVAAAPNAPSVAAAQAQDLSAVRAQSRCFEGGNVSTVQRRAGPAVLITYRADSAPDPVTGKVVHDDVERYEFWKAGTEAVITVSSPQGSDNVDPWRTVTDSFTWTT